MAPADPVRGRCAAHGGAPQARPPTPPAPRPLAVQQVWSATVSDKLGTVSIRTSGAGVARVTFSQEAARDRNLRSTFRSTGSCRSSPCSRRSASRRGIYALAMGDEAMQVLNLDAVRAL